MKRIPRALMITTCVLTMAFTIKTMLPWIVKEDAYSITFMGDNADGHFKGLKAILNFNEADLAGSKMSATIDVSTIDTGNWLKTRHAKSALDDEQYSVIKFESKSVGKTKTGYQATGDLTLKGVTKEIQLPFTFTPKPEGGVF